jgi:hypothetical protein
MRDPYGRRNILCLLPDGHIEVTYWMAHPCGGWWNYDALVYGPKGVVGRCA